MSGEFFGGDTPETDAMNANSVQSQDGGYETDVPDIKASGMKNNLLVFDVPENEFFTNMRNDRKRLRFGDETSVSKYLKLSTANKPFYLRTADSKFMRKVGK